MTLPTLKLPRSIKFRSLVFVVLTLAFTAGTLLLALQTTLSTRLNRMQDNSAQNILRLAELAVNKFYERLVDTQTRSLLDRKEAVRTQAQLILSTAAGFLNQMGPDRGRKAFLEWLPGCRTGADTFPFACGLDLVGLVHPDRSMRGRVWMGFKDPRGKEVMEYMRDMTLKHGQGFDSMVWPGADGRSANHLATFHAIPEMGILLGVAANIDRLDAEIRNSRQTLIKELKEDFAGIGGSSSGYLFLLDDQIRVLVHPFLEQGKEYNFLEERTGQPLRDILLEACRNKTPGRYAWKPLGPEGPLHTRVAHIRHFPPLDWHIGLSIDEAEMRAPVEELGRRLLCVLGGVLALALVICFWLVSRESRPLEKLTRLVDRIDPDGGRSSAIRVQLDTLAGQASTEIASAAAGLSRLLLALEERNGQLLDLNRELEDRIAERTRDLTQLARKLSAKVAELESTQEALLLAREDAERANQAKSLFLANMSHEIRTPLTELIGTIAMLAERVQDPSLAVSLKVMRTSAANLKGIVEDILDFSRIEAGQMSTLPSPADLEELCRYPLDLFEAKAGAKGLELALEMGPGLPGTVVVDAARTRQILVNLVSNAVKFTVLGRVLLRVDGQEDQDGRFRLRVRVEDTGPGLSSEDIASLFQPFRQLDQGYAKKEPGTGLGLALSRRLARLMGGELEAASIPGHGAVFTLTLPVRAVEKAQPRPQDRQDGRQKAFRLDGLRILIVDDNELIAMITSDMLTYYGASTRTAGSCEAALEALAREPFDLVLMDLQLPRRSGFEATRCIREEADGRFNPDIPIIAFSAYANEETIEQVHLAGMNGYLAKPYDPEDLLTAIRKAMGDGRDPG